MIFAFHEILISLGTRSLDIENLNFLPPFLASTNCFQLSSTPCLKLLLISVIPIFLILLYLVSVLIFERLFCMAFSIPKRGIQQDSIFSVVGFPRMIA